MFVENYRLDTMVGGQAQIVIPYPKISVEDWRKWKAFLPVRISTISQERVAYKTTFFENTYGIPSDVCQQWCEGPAISRRSRFGASVRSAKTPLRWA
jgi:hypothetical protein